jgi:hypothetical protein|tara:strand:- start:228 stop:419 length:192 start_codon:yes stop_codon:yes gene_type:complete
MKQKKASVPKTYPEKFLQEMLLGYLNGKNKQKNLILPNGKKGNIISYLAMNKKTFNKTTGVIK